MARYRPPAPKSSPYVTAPGYRALREERDALWVRRREVVVHLAAAAAEGDRSENAEYIYRKKQLRELDRRIGYLQRRLPVLEVVSDLPADPRRVFFGARVTLRGLDDRPVRYRIVGGDEIDADRGWISIDSPLARALLGREPGDEVEFETPAGTACYELTEVAYDIGSETGRG